MLSKTRFQELAFENWLKKIHIFQKTVPIQDISVSFSGSKRLVVLFSLNILTAVVENAIAVPILKDGIRETKAAIINGRSLASFWAAMTFSDSDGGFSKEL
jgi:hypothetical protein